jgi:hypothetical protein
VPEVLQFGQQLAPLGVQVTYLVHDRAILAAALEVAAQAFGVISEELNVKHRPSPCPWVSAICLHVGNQADGTRSAKPAGDTLEHCGRATTAAGGTRSPLEGDGSYLD